MKKEYQKPEVEILTLITEEKITNDADALSDDYVDGSMGTTGSIF